MVGRFHQPGVFGQSRSASLVVALSALHLCARVVPCLLVMFSYPCWARKSMNHSKERGKKARVCEIHRIQDCKIYRVVLSQAKSAQLTGWINKSPLDFTHARRTRSSIPLCPTDAHPSFKDLGTCEEQAAQHIRRTVKSTNDFQGYAPATQDDIQNPSPAVCGAFLMQSHCPSRYRFENAAL